MTTALRIPAGINLAGAVASLALLAATWTSQGVIVSGAKGYALRKAEAYLEPAIRKVETNLDHPMVPAPVRERLMREISGYRGSPDRFLLGFAADGRKRAEDFRFPEIRNPLARVALDQLTKVLAGARDHFKRSYASLIRDLRLFAATNACAFLIAAGLCFTGRARHAVGIWSATLLVSTLVSAFVYADQGWLWNILANRYLGWNYAMAHTLVTLYLVFLAGGFRNSGPQVPPR